MSATICGHEREELRLGLRFANASTLDKISRDWPRPDDSAGALLFDVHDPAKLAAILAELLREHGIELHVHAHCDGLRVIVANTLGHGPRLDMSSARRLALALLDAPNATAQDVERMIEEVTR